jgi:hypothetical protein
MGERKAPSLRYTRVAQLSAPPTPAKERLLDTRGQAQDGDTRNVINA